MTTQNKKDIVCQARRAPLVNVPYDERYPLIFERIRDKMAEITDLFEVGHIGSTAIPGAAGKGIIDIVVLYPEGAIDKTKQILSSVGFTGQGREFDSPFPDNRPMYIGRYMYEGDCFYVYAHVVEKYSDEVRRFREFRDHLRSNANLRKEYCDLKQSILNKGVRNSNEYTRRKNGMIEEILGSDYSLKS